jgi:hypothetical protein
MRPRTPFPGHARIEKSHRNELPHGSARGFSGRVPRRARERAPARPGRRVRAGVASPTGSATSRRRCASGRRRIQFAKKRALRPALPQRSPWTIRRHLFGDAHIASPGRSRRPRTIKARARTSSLAGVLGTRAETLARHAVQQGVGLVRRQHRRCRGPAGRDQGLALQAFAQALAVGSAGSASLSSASR